MEIGSGRLAAGVSLGQAVAAEPDDRTRDRLCREILQHGPVTASQLARTLNLSPAGVRRHLDQLLAEGVASVWEATDGVPRGRGRPARKFVLTDAGHEAMSTAYDDLASSALEFLADLGGPDAVRGFASARAQQLAARYRPAVEAAGESPERRVEVLAGALDAEGYAASTRSGPAGVQLCQGHCPVQHVAARFPQLCEAEAEAFSQLLGVHVQRLATLAHGDHVCTTHVPRGPATQGAAATEPTERTDRSQERTTR